MSFQNFHFALVLLCISVTSFIFSQENLVYGTYYLSDFDIIDRIILTERNIKSQTLQTYEVETPYWKDGKSIKIIEKLRNDGKVYFILGDKQSKNGGVILTSKKNGFIFFHRLNKPVNSVETLKSYKYSDLPLKLYFNQTFKEQFHSLKSMSLLTKGDLIKVVNFVHLKESLIKNYLNTNNLQKFHGFRISENLFNYKLYSLGYDPYQLPETGNYIDKFKNDSDIEALFEGDKIFKLRMD